MIFMCAFQKDFSGGCVRQIGERERSVSVRSVRRAREKGPLFERGLGGGMTGPDQTG